MNVEVLVVYNLIQIFKLHYQNICLIKGPQTDTNTTEHKLTVILRQCYNFLLNDIIIIYNMCYISIIKREITLLM